MKTGQIINRMELVQQGWKFITLYGSFSEVWGKEENRILWNSKTCEIELTYTSSQRYATGGIQ